MALAGQGGFRPAGTEDYSDEELLLLDADDVSYEFAENDASKTGTFDDAPVKSGIDGPSSSSSVQQSSILRNLSSAGDKTQPIRRGKGQGDPIIFDDFRLEVCRGNLEQVQHLLDNEGVAVDCSLRAGWTALMYAASSGHATIVELLLDRGADVNYDKASYMYTPLIAAASSVKERKRVSSCVSILLGKGANPNVHERSHMTPLMFVCKSGNMGALRKLLEFGAQTEPTDNRGWTALCYAAEKGFANVVQCLIDAGSDPYAKCSEGTPSDIAYNCGHFELAEILDMSTAGVAETKIWHQDSSPRNGQVKFERDPKILGSRASNQRCDDLDLFLCGLDLGHLLPVFHQQAVNFSTLLHMTRDDLEKVGVAKYGWRCKIADALHEIHKKKWEPGSLRAPGKNILSRTESISILENIGKHASYIGSGMVYMGTNWRTHGTLYDQRQDPVHLEQLRLQLAEVSDKATRLVREVQKLQSQLKEAVQSETSLPSDLIVKQDSDRGSRLRTIGVITLAAATLFICRKFPPFDRILQK